MIEKKWKVYTKSSRDQKIIVCESGTFIKKNDNEYLKYPDNTVLDKESLVKKQREPDNNLNLISKKVSLKSTDKSIQQQAIASEVLTEVIVSNVPNYLWYLNCALTSATMTAGYWDDQGYSNFIPGGDNINGHYRALTEELCLFQESPDISLTQFLYYTQANEYGNDVAFGESHYNKSDYDINTYWELYVKMIDSTQNPLTIGWMGPPYGAHSTVGVGYKVDNSEQYMILHDTWRSEPFYVNYNEYFESITAISHYYPLNKLVQNINKSILKEENKSNSPITLEPISLITSVMLIIN